MRLSVTGWVLTLIAGASVGALAPDAAAMTRDVTGPSFPAALLGAGSLVQLALSAWVLLATALSATASSTRLARAVTPVVLRRALFVGTAGALSLTPAHAEQLAAPPQHAPHSVDGLRLPDRPTAAPSDTPTTRPTRAHDVRDHAVAPVVVRRGDTLWGIASSTLPPGATDEAVARATASWHDANHSVIGADPDLIFPGQTLTPPLGKDPP